MLNIILSWIKENYEKVILGALSVLLIIVSLRLFFGGNTDKQIEDFKNEVRPVKTAKVDLEPIYDKNLEVSLIEKPYSYYEPINDRAVFFPIETAKEEEPLPPEMNFECTEIISSGVGFFTAVLKNTETGISHNVRSGDRVGEFSVRNITRDGVILVEGQGNSYTLKPPAVVMPLKLTGIMPAGEELEAMLQNTQTNKTYFVKEGGKAGDWEVLSIDENTVIIFRKDAGKYELKIGGQSQRIED